MSLKKISLTIKIRKPDSKKLLVRLTDILKCENASMDESLLKKLIIESNHDISSCINILQYLVSEIEVKNDIKEITNSHLFNEKGEFKFKKDMVQSIFDTWEKIMKVNSKFDPKLTISQIKKIVSECENKDRLNEGYFFNYSKYSYYDENMEKTCLLLESLGDLDNWDRYAYETQNFSAKSLTYLPSAIYHYNLSSTGKTMNEFPKLYYEIHSKRKEAHDDLEILRESKNEESAQELNNLANIKSIHDSPQSSHANLLLGSR